MLTELALKGAKARDKRYALPDREGLFAEVMPSGEIAFRYRYRLLGNREKVTLGSYPALSLKDARELHRVAINQVAKGISPATSKREARRLASGDICRGMTVRAFADLYIRDQVRPVRKDSTSIERYIKSAIVAPYGDMPIDTVTTDDVWRSIDLLRARGRLQSANLVRSIYKRLFDYALARRLVTANPVAGIKPKHVGPTNSRTRALSKSEVGIFLRRLYASSATRTYKLALHLIMITMARKGELVLARWPDVDLEAREWSIPAANSKTGRPHIVYLSEQAVELFRELKPLAGRSDLVLPSRSDPRKTIARNTLNVVIKGIDFGIEAFTVHDSRRTASTILHEAGFASDVIEKALNHTIGGVRGIYNRAEYAEQRKAMLQTWANLVDDAMNSGKVIVVPFGRSA